MENLIKLRKQAGLRQIDVAIAIGVDRTTYNKYEKDVADPPITSLVQLDDFFSVSTDFIIGHDAAKKFLDEDEKHIISVYRSLNQEGKKNIYQYIGMCENNPDFKKGISALAT